MKLLLALIVGAGALAPSMGPRPAQRHAMCRSAVIDGPTESGTAVLEDTEGLGAIKDDYTVPGRILCAAERAEAVKTYARHEGDVGSSEVQIALFTARIKYITEHVINNPKDHATRRGLLALVSKRRRLLHYLYSRNPSKAEKLADDLD